MRFKHEHSRYVLHPSCIHKAFEARTRSRFLPVHLSILQTQTQLIPPNIMRSLVSSCFLFKLGKEDVAVAGDRICLSDIQFNMRGDVDEASYHCTTDGEDSILLTGENL